MYTLTFEETIIVPFQMDKSALWTEHSAPCQHGYVRSFLSALDHVSGKSRLGH